MVFVLGLMALTSRVNGAAGVAADAVTTQVAGVVDLAGAADGVDLEAVVPAALDRADPSVECSVAAERAAEMFALRS
ncbi:MAG TPA: hypothetical protein VGM90_22235 [Kofleriaceae bacterium]|jgi:hypothetical protein